MNFYCVLQHKNNHYSVKYKSNNNIKPIKREIFQSVFTYTIYVHTIYNFLYIAMVLFTIVDKMQPNKLLRLHPKT